MKELVVISGKGGAGKTSITASLAVLAGKSVIVDADVDAADMHLVISKKTKQEYDFKAGFMAIMDTEKCTECGLCRKLCQFSAINEKFEIDHILCEGCGVCACFCPEQAIIMQKKTCGKWFVSDTGFGTMIHARLFPGEESSGLLVSRLRQEARETAEKQGIKMILIDGPPGIGCPVIASITGASHILAVAEPTLSGVHDVKRVGELADFFHIPVSLCINKSGLNPELEKDLKDWAIQKNIHMAGEVPYDGDFTSAMMEGKTVVEFSNGKAAGAIRTLWENIRGSLDI